MQVYEKALELMESHRSFVLASVIRASGSTPQKAGAKALFERSGPVWGTLGGGCLEAESRARALRALDDGVPQAFDLSLDEDYGWDDGLICGGRVRILVEPDVARHREAYRAALEALARRDRGVLATLLRHREGSVESEVRWIAENDVEGRDSLPDPSAVKASLDEEKARHTVFGDAPNQLEVFLEPVMPAPRLFIAGGGHIGQALARLGDFLGFDVTVIDDRSLFTDPRLYPENVRTVCADIPTWIAAAPAAHDTYFVIVTRGHRHDGEALAACVRTPAAYIGLIGSKRKILLIRKRFLEEGIASEDELDRVFSPMGLDIGSSTVPEIATSIAAELVAVRRGRQGAGRHLAEAIRG